MVYCGWWNVTCDVAVLVRCLLFCVPVTSNMDFMHRAQQELNITVHMQTIEDYLADHSDERNTFDACTCLLVLCSVPQPAPLVSDLCSACLKPGGKLVFLEHVAAKPGTCTSCFLRAYQPLWNLIGDGCQLSRPTADTIALNGEWSSVHVEPAEVESTIPWVKGWAVKDESKSGS